MMQYQDFRPYELKPATSISATIERFTVYNPCPICGGYDNLPRGKGIRCGGFLSGNGQYAYCMRDEHAGPLELYGNTNAYLHYLAGPCRCGIEHDCDIDDSDDAVVVRPAAVDSNTDKPLPWRETPDHTYDYTDEDGNPVYQVLRYDATPVRGKSFSQRRKDPTKAHEWAYNLNGCKRYPYNLQEVRNAPLDTPIIIVEGEKCVDCLKELGFVATCNSGGAGKWSDELDDHFRGRQVVIIPDVGDNNGVGERHAEDVAQHLSKVAQCVRVATLPELSKGDVVNWFSENHTTDDLQAVIDAAPVWNPAALHREVGNDLTSLIAPTQWQNPDSRLAHKRESTNLGLILTPLSDLLAEPEEETAWLVEGLLPSGGLSILGAKPKVGKSTLARNLALRVARGDNFLDRQTEQGAVIYLALEEKRQEVRRHFQRMGADSEPIHIHVGRLQSAAAIQALESMIIKHNAALVIVDPMLKFVHLKDANDYSSVSSALELVMDLARRTNCHILLVHHMGKGDRVGSEGFLGSTAIFGAVDTGLMMYRNQDQRSLQSDQRYGNNMLETALTLDTETGIVTAGGEALSLRKGHVQGAIFAALKDGSLKEPDLRKRVGGNQTVTSDVLRELVQDEEITRIGKGVKGAPYVYALAPKPTIPDSRLAPIPESRIGNDIEIKEETDRQCEMAI